MATAVTAVAVAVKNALEAPACTVTVAGTVNAVLLLDRFTATPPAGAGALSETVQLSVPAPTMVERLQNRPLREPAAASPVPLRLTTTDPPAGASDVMDSEPVAAPAVCGPKFTWTVTALPGLRVIGNPGPVMEKPAPLTVAAVTVSGALPVENTVTDCGVACDLTVTSPNDRLLALRLIAGVPLLDCAGLSCRLKVAELVPRVALTVAVCAALTAAAVSVKFALLALAGTATLAGTTTAESLLERLMVLPPVPTAALSVMEQLSVPPPVMVALLQETAVTVGSGAGDGFVAAVVPIPLRVTVIGPEVELLATVSVPAADPAAVGLNVTFTVSVAAPARVMGSVLWVVSEND